VDVKKYGKNKDMGSPFRDSSEEEQKLMQKAVNDFGERLYAWCKNIANRNGSTVRNFNSRVFLAEEALKLGLVDKIGYLSDAVKESKMLAVFPRMPGLWSIAVMSFLKITIIIRPVLRLKI